MIALGCAREPTEQPEERSVTDREVQERGEQLEEELLPSVADGFALSLWASEELLSDPVAIHMDDQGRAWVSITERRRNAEIDIRGLRDLEIESILLETTEERRELIHRRFSPELGRENEWPEDLNEDGSNDWRDLTVPKESIFLIEDETDSGQANRSSVFIRDFNDEMNDVAGAVLHHEGDVFLGVSPDLWRIRDTSGDGYGDSKESIAYGFGVNIAFGGHGLSGLTVGPDGRLYWSIGDPGMSVTDREGKRWHYPRQGVIVRSEPDGSNFEVFAAGLRNTHEFSFDKYGNLITVDNDGDHAGEFERLVYLVDGSDSGWRINWQFGKYNDPLNNSYNPLMDEEYYKPRFENQAAHLLPPLARYHSGPAGMVYNPGTALSEEWNDHFFLVSFVGAPSRSRIYAFSLTENGASFELDRDELILEGILATGLDVGPDGALYFSDWIEGWQLKQAGRIWKLDTPGTADFDLRRQTRQLLAESMNNRPAEELLDLLNHADMRVRQKAQFELAERGDSESLLTATDQENDRIVRIHGIWGLAQIARRDVVKTEPLIELLDDSDPEIRAQSAKMLGDVRYEPSADRLIESLGDEHARVRYFATEALGRIGYREALEPILEMLEENDDDDVYLRHGGAIALERIGDEGALAELTDHSSSAVRLAAVVALQRLNSPGVTRFLNDQDPFIVTSAARAINDDRQIEEGIPDLAAMLDQDRFFNEPLIRRAINANLYEGELHSAQRLARFAARQGLSVTLREEALRTLEVWDYSSKLDRVTGDPRGRVENSPELARSALDPVASALLTDPDTAVMVAALETMGSLRFSPAVIDILGLLEDAEEADVRIAALEALMRMEYEEIEEAVLIALEDHESRVRLNALAAIPDLELPIEDRVELLETVLEEGTVQQKQMAMETLARMDNSVAHLVLARQLSLLEEHELEPEIELDLLLAIRESSSGEFQERLEAYEADKPDEPMALYREALYGGDVVEGERIFYENSAAQCIRCHVVAGEGSDIGPDLTTVADRLTRQQLLESMVDPNARVADGYGSVSSMPAMGDALSRSELRDLVEYLTTLRGRDNRSE